MEIVKPCEPFIGLDQSKLQLRALHSGRGIGCRLLKDMRKLGIAVASVP